MRKLLLIILILVCSITAFGRGKLQGYASQGSSIRTAGTSSTDKALKVYPNCTVTFYQAGTTTLLTRYIDDAGTVGANPTTADSMGYYFGYFDNGPVDIRFSGTGIAVPFTLGAVEVFSGDDVSLRHSINVATCATAGAGTIASPWTGWNNTGACVWGNKSYYFGGQANGTPGVYSTSTTINWSFGPNNNNPTVKPIYVEGNNATINCTGSGTNCITIASATDSNADWLHGLNVRHLKVRNTGTWSRGLYVSGNFSSTYEDIDSAWFTSKNFYLRGIVTDHFVRINSFPEPSEPVTTDPLFVADDLLSSDNEFLNVNFVGATHSSIYLGNIQNSYFTGTAEGNQDADRGGIGLICNTNCRSNTFKMDNEGNEIGGTGRDFSIDGYNNVFLGTMSTGILRLTGGSKHNVFLGGIYNSVTIDSGALQNEFDRGLYNVSGTGAFSDSGTDTRYYLCNYGSPTACLDNVSAPHLRPGNSTDIGGYKFVQSGVALSGGTATVTLTGLSIFTGTNTYQCYFNNETNANPVKYTRTSGSQFTITGTGSDVIGFTCIGY